MELNVRLCCERTEAREGMVFTYLRTPGTAGGPHGCIAFCPQNGAAYMGLDFYPKDWTSGEGGKVYELRLSLVEAEEAPIDSP
jgi:hypothetical protein